MDHTRGRLCADVPQVRRRLLSAHLGWSLVCLLLLMLLLLLRTPLLLLLGWTGRPRCASLHMSIEGPLDDFALIVAPFVPGLAYAARIAWRWSLM